MTPVTPATASAPEITAATNPRLRLAKSRDWFDRLWSLLGSVRFGISLIAIVAVAVFAGTVIMQAPGTVQAAPDQFAAWLAGPRARYGEPWATIFEYLDCYRIFQSVWFRSLLALLALSIAVNTTTRAPGIISAAMRPPVNASNRLFDVAPHRATTSCTVNDPVVAIAEATIALRRSGYRVIATHVDGAPAVYADRNRFGRFGTFANHLGLITILGAAVVGNVTGWREDAFMVPEGSVRAVGHDTGLSVRNEAFVESYYPNGTASDFYSDLTVFRDGREVARGSVRVNDPLVVDGVRFHQAFFGPAVAMRVRNANGDVVYNDRVALGMTYDGDGVSRNGGNFVIGNRQYAVFVLVPSAALQGPDPAIPAGSVRLEVFAPRQPKPVAVETLAQGERRAIVGYEFEFVREVQFSGLQVVSDPSVNVIWFGAALMLLGTLTVFNLPLRRIWVRTVLEAHGTSLRFASTNPRGVLADREFADLANRVFVACSGAPTS
jgi:cytochrome c biogenesis protein